MSRIFATPQKAVPQAPRPGKRVRAMRPPASRAGVREAVRRRPVQTKLRIGAPDDRYEREADRVADQVMRMREPGVERGSAPPDIQPMCGECTEERLQRQAEEEEEEEPVQAKRIQRMCTECEEEQLQRQPLEEEEEEPLQTRAQRKCSECDREERRAATRAVSSRQVLDGVRGGGARLPSSERRFFEPRFGRSFENVRIHVDSRADAASRAISARAFTHGTDIAFARGEYAPGTSSGRRLLAHELTHTVQQTAGRGPRQVGGVSRLGTVARTKLVQRDLAIRPPRPDAVGRTLSAAEIQEAITFNQTVLGAIDNSTAIIALIRDVFGGGVPRTPAVVDADFVRGVVEWQAMHRLHQDGKLGPRTARPLFREIGAEGEGRGQVQRGPRYNTAGPINVARAGTRTATFRMSADFVSNPARKIFPSCCEIRQDIQWDAAFVAASVAQPGGLRVPHTGFPAAHPPGRWIEDRDSAGKRYGHRTGRFSDPGSFDQYLDNTRRNQAFGHRFRGSDSPEGFATDRGSWRFRLRVVDVCNRNRRLATSRTLVLNWL